MYYYDECESYPWLSSIILGAAMGIGFGLGTAYLAEKTDGQGPLIVAIAILAYMLIVSLAGKTRITRPVVRPLTYLLDNLVCFVLKLVCCLRDGDNDNDTLISCFFAGLLLGLYNPYSLTGESAAAATAAPSSPPPPPPSPPPETIQD